MEKFSSCRLKATMAIGLKLLIPGRRAVVAAFIGLFFKGGLLVKDAALRHQGQMVLAIVIDHPCTWRYV